MRDNLTIYNKNLFNNMYNALEDFQWYYTVLHFPIILTVAMEMIHKKSNFF